MSSKCRPLLSEAVHGKDRMCRLSGESGPLKFMQNATIRFTSAFPEST
jgi:hypothetical protein